MEKLLGSLMRTVGVALALLLGGSTATAQDAAAAPDGLGRETPRGTVSGFRREAARGDNARAARYLDFSALEETPDDEDQASLARDLRIVLDRTVILDPAQLSDDARGNLEDGLPPDLEVVGTIVTKRGEVPLRLRRGEDGLWRIGPFTVSAIRDLYAEFGYGPLGDALPSYFFQVTILDLELWQWIGLLVLVLLASLAGYVVTSLAVLAVRAFVRAADGWRVALLHLLGGPLRLTATVLFFYAGSFLLALPLSTQGLVGLVCKATTVVAVTWLVLRAVEALSLRVQATLEARDPNAARTLVPMGRRITTVFVLVVAGVSLVHNLGFNVAGLLAGLGVGGLAVALIVDQPVEVGEYCRVGEHVGTVEDVGLRSTRVRTLDRTVVTIPNAEFSTARIENYARRDKMRIYSLLQVGYDTSPDQMRHLLMELRRTLLAHPRILDDPCRVRFVTFNAYSLDIEVFAYAETTDWTEFLGIREDVWLRIMDVVAASGTYFAYPSQTLYLGKDAGRDAGRTTAAEEDVRRRRAEGTLGMPDFPADERAALRCTADWPPEGSALRA